MAEQTILKVSLKDYKAQIENLRASLLTLDSASEQYQQTAQQVKEMQDKLNEVMSVGKKSVEGVEGSYNALREELSELKKEWQTLEIGSDKWNELGSRIDNINDQLKEADASIGIFNRNVGDYANSFEEAGNVLLDNFTMLNPTIANAANAIKRLIPMIKATTNTATAGLKGIKAVIASTGIGALIIALGILGDYVARNWDAIKDWATGVAKARKEHEELTKEIERTKQASENYIQYMKGVGENEFAIQAKQLETLKNAHSSLAQEYNLYIATHRKNSKFAKELYSGMTEAASAVTEQQEQMRVSLDIFVESQKRAGEQEYMSELDKTLADINDEFSAAVENAVDLAKEAGASLVDIVILRQEYEELRKEALERAKRQAGKSQWEKERDEIKARTKEITDSYKTESQKLTEKYKEELKLFKKHKQDTKELTERYNADMAELERNLAAEQRVAIESSYNALLDPKPMEYFKKVIDLAGEELDVFAEKTGEKLPPLGLSDTINLVSGLTFTTQELEKYGVKSAEEFALKWYAASQRLQMAQKSYDENILGSIKLNSGLEKSTETLSRKLLGLEENTTEYAKTEISITKTRIDYLTNYLNVLDETSFKRKEDYEAAKREAEDLLAVEEKRLKQQERTLKNSALQAQIDRANYEAEKASQNTGKFLNNSNFGESWQARISAARTALDIIKQMEFENEQERLDALLQAQNNMAEAERAFLNERIANWSELGTNIGSIISSIGDWYEQDIENQVKNGKLSEKEAEKEYRRVQGIKVADAVIQTLSGALAAFMGYQSLGQPWGSILGAAAAAAVAATGAIEIKKIKSQNPYSSSSVGSSSYASATPKLMDYSPDYFSNLTSKSDTDYLADSLGKTNLYVSVTDINNAQNKVKVRDNNSTF